MLNKTIDLLLLVTGIVSVLSAIAFAVFVKLASEIAMLISGISLLLIGGMYLATSIISIVDKYFTKGN